MGHFRANSAGTFKASQNHNKNFGITQQERLVIEPDVVWTQHAVGMFFGFIR
jgi:hypothetical protein